MSRLHYLLALGLALAAVCFVGMFIPVPAFAQTQIATVEGSTLKLSWEALLAALGPSIASLAVTVFTGLATILLGRFAPVWLSSLLQSRIETTVQTAVDYALNDVHGAAKGKTLSVPVGSAVVATALQRIVDSTSPWLVGKVKGGLPELANRVFRKLDLVPEATAANVVAPAIQTLPDLAARG